MKAAAKLKTERRNSHEDFSRLTLFVVTLVIVSLARSAVAAPAELDLSQGQSCYVPAYSQIYGGNREREILLTVTLSVRNTGAKHAITFTPSASK